MKQSIKWHKECLFNFKASIIQEEKRIYDMQQRVNRDKDEAMFYSEQIAKAERQGKNGFDKYKFMIKKDKKE